MAGLLLAAGVLTACGPPGSVEQGRFAESAGSLAAPDGFVPRDAPTRLCEALGETCTDPTVVSTFIPSASEPDAAAVCEAYLAWAAQVGITSVFIGTGRNWTNWFEPDEHSFIITGAIDTIPLGTPDALDLCLTIVQRLLDLPPDAARGNVHEFIGIGGVSGVAGGLVVARVMPPRTVPDGAAERGEPRIMIAVVYALI